MLMTALALFGGRIDAVAVRAEESPVQAAVQDRKPKKKLATVEFDVNMHCKNCEKKISDKLSFLKGVEDLKISLPDKRVTVTYNEAKTTEAEIRKAIEACGYTATRSSE